MQLLYQTSACNMYKTCQQQVHVHVHVHVYVHARAGALACAQAGAQAGAACRIALIIALMSKRGAVKTVEFQSEAVKDHSNEFAARPPFSPA